MAVALRRNSSHRRRDQRRRWFHLQPVVFVFLCFSAVFAVCEFSRDGYLTEYLGQRPKVILHHYASENRRSNFLHTTFQHNLAERDWSVGSETSSRGWVKNRGATKSRADYNNRSSLQNSDQRRLSINSRNEEPVNAGKISKIISSRYSEVSDTENHEELWNPPGYSWLGQGFFGKFITWLSSEDSETANSKLGEEGSVGSLVHSLKAAYMDKLDAEDGGIPGSGAIASKKSLEGDKSLILRKQKTDEEAYDKGASWPESNKTLSASDQCNHNSLVLGKSDSEFELPRVIHKCWKPPQPCGTTEEMGLSVVGDTRAASLRVRQMIKLYMVEHGAQRVVSLPGEEFCKRSFVLGQAFEDGFGNNMYKLLTAASLSLMLNRSLIIGERGATNPAYVGGSKKPFIAFGDYIMFSNETFSMQKVKHLWALHDCAGKYNRPLTMQVDDLELGFARSRCLCDDWTVSPNAIIWFKGTSDTVGLQCLLKNANAAMRSVAAKLLGNPSFPNSRPNTFGELLQAFMSPSPDIHHAVTWALKGGPDPDIALHLRMRHKHDQAAIAAASTCILRTTHTLTNSQRKQHLVVVSDTPEVFPKVEGNLGQFMETFQFDYMAYLKEFKNLSEVMSLHYGQPPRNRMKDWGEMPRWVSLVDFFLAARARVAVISGASERVSTTYAQLVASLAAASTMIDGESSQASESSVFYSSFQPDLVAQGLMKQSGWGHSWRTFGGKLGCRNQTAQCARTPLLPYAWWDSPWQSPSSRDIHKLQMIGIQVDEAGQVSEDSLDEFCAAQEKPIVLQMRLPTCTKLKPCTLLIS